MLPAIYTSINYANGNRLAILSSLRTFIKIIITHYAKSGCDSAAAFLYERKIEKVNFGNLRNGSLNVYQNKRYDL